MKLKLKLSPALLTDSWELKLTALGLSMLLWAAVRSEEMTRFTMRAVPVEVRMVADVGWVPQGVPDPETVEVEFIGPVRELLRLAFAEATLVVPAEGVDDTLEVFHPRAEWLSYDRRFDNLRVDQLRPPALRMRFQPIESRMVPVAVRLDSPLKSTRPAVESASQPAQVLVEGPRNRVESIDSLIVRVADVEAAIRAGAVRLRIDTVGLGVTISPHDVVVRLRAAPTDSIRTLPASGAGWP